MHGCVVADCASDIVSVGKPVIWWLGALVVIATVVTVILWRDGRACGALAGIAGGYLPWLMYSDRTIFTFYAVAFEPWMLLCLAFVLGLVNGPPDAEPDRRLAEIGRAHV